ncbi:MFS transporter [Microbulbifer sp. GL-2]|uniref:MFS transporter n=1 Tax=Microbulbifer sp. GL-2 TaxID=2591606 RepID=UPI001164B32C|nr:MFS transporter [Microbulbifer sp. GL-2]BBM00654.1 MFS transporter [Microbulbifer sp. GL-2]
MAQHNQFKLLCRRRFLPLFFSLITAAFNDNLFKNALLVMLAFRLAESEANALINLATGFYILPYFLFSVTAGQLADKYDKGQIIRILKLAEIFIVLLGAFALLGNNRVLSFVVLFLLATHTAIFSPVQYAILPQHLKRTELMGGNGMAQMGSFAGVLSGTIIGTLLAGFTKPGQPGLLDLSLIMVFVAIFGYLSSRAIPAAPPSSPQLHISWNPLSQAWRILRLIRKTPTVFYAILACSWFWLVSSAYLAQVPSFTRNVLGANEPVITIILCCLSVGVAVGSLMCESLSRGRITFGIVPLGSVGITISGLGLGLTAAHFQTLSGASVSEYLQSDGAYAILIYTALLGIFGGIYIVPLYTIMQDRADKAVRAQILSVNNVLNAFFIVVISLVNIALLDTLKITIPQLFILVALLNIIVMVFLFIKLPDFIAHLLIWLSSHLLARTQCKNPKRIPETGAALLLCRPAGNLSALLLIDALQRPVRFLLPDKSIKSSVMRFILNYCGAKPIFYRHAGSNEDQLKALGQAVENGELLCFFPGTNTENIHLSELNNQMLAILSKSATPLLPVRLIGLETDTRLAPASEEPGKSRIRFLPKVNMQIGRPVSIKNVSLDTP